MEPGEIIRRAREAKGWSQDDLAKKVLISQPAIKKIEAGDTRQSKHLPQIAAALDIELREIMPGIADPDLQGIIPRKELIGFNSDWPVHASAEGGPGQIIVSSDAVDFMPRPAVVVHTKDAYGIIVSGTSMEPEFKQGDIAIVNPHLPPTADEPHVFYAEKEGQARATIKKLRRASGEKWLVTQHNPPNGAEADFSLSRKEWQWAHRVVGSYKRR